MRVSVGVFRVVLYFNSMFNGLKNDKYKYLVVLLYKD